MAPSRLSQLAAQIQASTATIDGYLQSHGLPEPSFAEDGPVEFGLKSEEAKAALDAAKSASLELFELLQGPALALRPVYDGVSLQAIYKYDIAAHVPIHGEISFEDLSSKCGLGVTNLRRILRFAMAWNRCFTEPRKGFVAHSAASRVLVDNPMARSGLGFMFEECWQSFAHTIPAIEEHGETEDITKTGWSHYHKTDKSLFEHHASHPEMSRRMAEAMQCFNSAVAESSQASGLVKDYPWDTLGTNGTAKVVDVGGAQGHISIEIARAYPSLNFVVQDLPDVVKGTQENLPADVKDRIEVMPHDFFKEQPLEADVYLYSWIFHDWPDAHCTKILRALIPKLRTGARVVCYDHLLPEPGTAPILRERAARDMDMIMLSLFNSHERDADDWVALFEAADARFGRVKAWIPEGGKLGIIEAIWQG